MRFEEFLLGFVLQSTILSASVRSECSSQALGMVSRRIKDHQITASSYGSDWTRPSAGRLLNKGELSEQTFGGWCAERIDVNQYLEINLLLETVIRGVATQGMATPAGNWVTKYALNYSCDGRMWSTFMSRDKQMVFHGNQDGESIVKNTLSKPVIARRVRIHPLDWNAAGSICMRLELYGCVRTYGESDDYEDCRSPLGLENRSIKNSQIVASSSFEDHLAPHARLNNLYQLVNGTSVWGAWCTNRHDKLQYLQVDLGRVQRLSGLATQGYKYGSWVTEYRVNHSVDGVTWTTSKTNDSVKVFSGNWDSDSVVFNSFDGLIKARLIRVLPQAWYSMICLRLELYECKMYQGCTERSTADPVTAGQRTTSSTTNKLRAQTFSPSPSVYTKRAMEGFRSSCCGRHLLQLPTLGSLLILWLLWKLVTTS